MSTFFSKDNIHRATWSLLGAGVLWAASTIYVKIYGPSSVVLDTSTRQIPVQVTVRQPDDNPAMAAALEHMATAVEKLQRKQNGSPEQQLRTLSKQVRDLQSLVSRADNPRTKPPEASLPARGVNTSPPSVQTSKIGTPASAETLFNEHPNQQPTMLEPTVTFDFPAKVKGYTQASLIGTEESSCPIRKMASGTPIQIGFILSDSSLIPRASPLFVNIDRVDDPTHLFQVFQRLFTLKPGSNIITINSQLSPATYNVTYGFYRRSEIDAEYPKFYARTCKIDIYS